MNHIVWTPGFGTQEPGWSLHRQEALNPHLSEPVQHHEIIWRPVPSGVWDGSPIIEEATEEVCQRLDRKPAAFRACYPLDDLLAAIAEAIGYFASPGYRANCWAAYGAVVLPLVEAGEPVAVIAHSWGTVVAYQAMSFWTPGKLTLFTPGAALSMRFVRRRLHIPEDRRPLEAVRKWINLDAVGDLVGGTLAPYFPVDFEFLNLPAVGCGQPPAFACAHENGYFHPDNQRALSIFARHIEE